jgi:hypothetical protein
VNGQSFTGLDSTAGYDFEMGNQVLVYYDSQNPNKNALTDFAELSRIPFISVHWWNARLPEGFLIAGILFLFPAVAGTFTGKAFAPHRGWDYRAERPNEFWLDVALFYLGGIGFILYFLYLVT